MQAVRPDRLATAMTGFVCGTLGVSSISPPPLSIATVLRQEASAGASHTPSSITTHHYQAPLLQPLLLLLFPYGSFTLLLPVLIDCNAMPLGQLTTPYAWCCCTLLARMDIASGWLTCGLARTCCLPCVTPHAYVAHYTSAA